MDNTDVFNLLSNGQKVQDYLFLLGIMLNQLSVLEKMHEVLAVLGCCNYR